MDYMYDLKEKLCDELEEYARKQDMSAGDLEMVHKLTDTIKNIDKISMLEEEGGYSREGYSREGGSYSRDYDREASYRSRRRDSKGQYSREGDYSREGGNSRMMEELEVLMDQAGSEEERRAIRRFMDQMKRI